MVQDDNMQGLKQLLECQTLQQLTDKAGGIFGNPCFAVDISHRILAKPSGFSEEYRKWEMLRDNDYVPLTIFSKELPADALGYSLQYFLLASMDGAPDTKLVRKGLAMGGRVVGYLCIFVSDEEALKRTAALIEWVSRLALILMLSEHPGSGFYSPYQFFLVTLLENPELHATHEITEAQRQRLDIQLNPHKYILSAHVGELEEANTASLIEIMGEFGRAIPNSYPFIYKESVVVLFSRNSIAKKLWMFLAPLVPVVEKYNLICGVSNNFGSLTQCQEAYTRAQTAINLGRRINKDKSLLLYEDYIHYYMMEVCSRSKELEGLCHPCVLELLYRDTRDGTGHLNTLYHYLSNRNSLAKTAEEMGVHRNTIKYRISQIVQITGADLTDGLEVFSLMRSLQILKYMERF